MATVCDVAAYILERLNSMSTMKLQKLCYYSQGWSLAWDGVPIFNEDFEAWANGPVCYELYKQHRGSFQIASIEAGDSSRLTRDQVETIDAVLDAYGHLSGQALSDKTHAERPWLEARGTLSAGARSNKVVEKETMQDFFGGLANSTN